MPLKEKKVELKINRITIRNSSNGILVLQEMWTNFLLMLSDTSSMGTLVKRTFKDAKT